MPKKKCKSPFGLTISWQDLRIISSRKERGGQEIPREVSLLSTSTINMSYFAPVDEGVDNYLINLNNVA